MAADYWNTVNVTVELSSFGRPKEEMLKPHLRPLREAATITWSKHSLGYSQPSQPGSQRGQPATHHRQRETSDVREPPEDIHSRHGDTEEKQRTSTAPAAPLLLLIPPTTGGTCQILTHRGARRSAGTSPAPTPSM
ncbi:hypothetical protein Taro_007431 [Colocasia esculenta]|uniref:Uncharacterized protein n=1 Tax=Colocasia esculenta TaxID=4460 RepID=A0A843U0B2_COLES|nr:hypothetical protein [Colocasia esculenta]